MFVLKLLSKTPKQTNTEARRGLFFLVLTQMMVGINIVLAKYLLTTVPLSFLLATRFVLATLFLVPLHWLTKARKKPLKSYFSNLNKKDYVFITAQALCGGALFNFFMFLGLSFTDANLAGIIASALPALIAIMAWLILGEAISRKKIVCVGAACLGLLVIALSKVGAPIKTAHSFVGDFIVFLALFPEALYYILCKLHPNQLPVFLVSTIMNAINGIMMLVVLYFVPFDLSTLSLNTWMILIISALSSGLFYVFWFIGSQRVDAMMASLTTAVMPIATVVFAWLILNEDLTLMEGVGMSLVILSIMMYAKK